MNNYYFKFFFLLSISIILFSTSCKNKTKQESPEVITPTNALDRIYEEQKLIAITDYSSTNYFIYKGQPMGFHYELLKLYADFIGVKLELKIENNLDKAFQQLQNQECDVLGIDLTVTKKRSEIISFTTPLNQSRQVLVQRKPENYKSLSSKEIEKQLIRNQLELGGKTVYVQGNSSFAERLHNLSNEIGDTINIKEDTEFHEERLITMVAKGEIDYTVCDEHVGMVNSTYYPLLDVKTPISFPQNLAWGVNKGSFKLQKSIDKWLTAFKETKKYTYLYNKYFKNKKSVAIFESEFNSLEGGKISKYDDLIKKYAKEIDWDWRLLASLIYQESRFDPNVVSWAGAFGLMQLMPVTADRFGASPASSTEVQIAAGVKFIKYLDDRFRNRITDENERILFILASYNAGPGHIFDAQRLAEKNGKDSSVWFGNVDTFLLLKSNPQYYHDPVVKHGYSRGIESYNFVKQIMERYEHYKNAIKI